MNSRNLINVRFAAGLIIFWGFLVYANSLAGVFLFDDYRNIIENERIRSFRLPWAFWDNVRRPVLLFSLAVNYALGKYHPFGYHLGNILIHISSALLLFGIVQRTLLRVPGKIYSLAEARLLALTVALIWLVHPLQTGSVTYIIQRAESLMGMFFLLTLYASIRYFSSRKIAWCVAAAAAAVLSGLTKEVAVVLPLVVLLYDRAYVSSTFRQAMIAHRQLHFTLLGMWVVMFYLLSTVHPPHAPSAGFDYKGVTSWQYALTQPQIILHYLRLSIFPYPLVLDYAWLPAKEWGDIFLPLALILSALTYSVMVYIRRPHWGFPLISFFIILAPTSSFFPLKDLAFEHRMYLPLGCVFAVLVPAGWNLIKHVSLGNKEIIRAGVGAVLCLLAGFSFLTIQRNRDYDSRAGMWSDIARKRPNNPRALHNVGIFLMEYERWEEALPYLMKAVELDPEESKAQKSLGNYYNHQGDYHKAVAYYQRAVEIKPDYHTVYISLGDIFFKQNRLDEAQSAYDTFLNYLPYVAIAHNSLGAVYLQQGKIEQAISHFEYALHLDSSYDNARFNLNLALQRRDDSGEGINVQRFLGENYESIEPTLP